jgi:hypothetical protein
MILIILFSFSRIPKIQNKKTVSNVIKETIYHEIPAKSKREFLRVIEIPLDIIPSIENCEIIKLSYELWVKAKTIGWTKSPCLKLPILIGTSPILHENFVNPPPYEDSLAQSTSFDDTSSDDDD